MEMVEFVVFELSNLHPGYSCVARWCPQKGTYVEIKGETCNNLEEARARARQLNLENQEEHEN